MQKYLYLLLPPHSFSDMLCRQTGSRKLEKSSRSRHFTPDPCPLTSLWLVKGLFSGGVGLSFSMAVLAGYFMAVEQESEFNA